jgi:hypothetical protein
MKTKENRDVRIQPEKQGFQSRKKPPTEAGKAAEHRLAQAKRILRLHDEWKAMQN